MAQRKHRVEAGATPRPAIPRLRATLIELAWLWRRHQPESALTLWFEDRVKADGGRVEKTLLVALARKLLVALSEMQPPRVSWMEGVPWRTRLEPSSQTPLPRPITPPPDGPDPESFWIKANEHPSWT